MPDVLSFDQLNRLGEKPKRRSMPYEEYFGEMPISEEQKERRIATAERLEDGIFPLLLLAGMMMKNNMVDYERLRIEMEDLYEDVLEDRDVAVSEDYRSYHIPAAIAGIIATMMMRPDDEFNFSQDRAMLIAENEANDAWNDAEFLEAVENGMTMKTWNAIMDNRTRETHRAVDGTTIPINEFFVVGEALMLYPKYDCEYPEEVVNCRCSLTYS